MRHFLILASLAFVTGAVADEGDFDFKNQEATRALENYRNKLSEEQQIQRDAIEILKNETKAFEAKWRKELIAKLEAIRTKLRKDADLSEANKINDAIKALKKASPAGGSTAGSKGKKNKAQIPTDAVEWNGHYYWISSDGAPWRDAKSRCESLGGHLVRITSAQEHSFVKSLIDRSQLRRSHYWTDGSDEASEGDWRFSDGQPVSYNGWKRGEPEGGRVCNHLALWNRSNWGFADDSGSAGFSFICEWDGPAGSTQRAKKIPADAVKYKGNYYKAYNEGIPHSVAKKRCEMMGGHLARIENAAENQFLTQLSAQFPRSTGMWIDGSDASREGMWRFSNNAPMKYTNWWPGEPTNDNKVGHHVELMASYQRANGQRGFWNDIESGRRDRGFICEWDE